MAWQRRPETDYVFDFWTALGWSILTCGIYSYYIVYQLVRRSRDHNQRRLELLDAAATFAWEQAGQRGLTEELRPNFDRISVQLATLRRQTSDFREPLGWTLLLLLDAIVIFVVRIIVLVLLDSDRVAHDAAEGGIEAELSAIFDRLGAPVAPPDPTRLKGRHNDVGRVVATLATCGIYLLWWTYDVMTELNAHFRHNWAWEDDLARSAQQLMETS